jgi:hypothetical protein
VNSILLNNVAANTTSTGVASRGGKFVAIIRGDSYGGGTVNIQVASANDPGLRYATLSAGAFTANGQLNLDFLPVGLLVRAEFTGATAPSNVFVEIMQ